MIDLSLNKQSQSNINQARQNIDNEGPDTPNKTSYFGFRVQTSHKKSNESLTSSLKSGRFQISQNCNRNQDDKQNHLQAALSPNIQIPKKKYMRVVDFCQS